jgi:hypothetical protein
VAVMRPDSNDLQGDIQAGVIICSSAAP